MYLGKASGVYYFDDFEYKEIEIEDGMRWLQRAPDRIKNRRMERFRLAFYDVEDWPIDYGAATVELQRHSFPLGVQLDTKLMSGVSAADYLWYLKVAAQTFWAGWLDKQLLWPLYEPKPGAVSTTPSDTASPT